MFKGRLVICKQMQIVDKLQSQIVNKYKICDGDLFRVSYH